MEMSVHLIHVDGDGREHDMALMPAGQARRAVRTDVRGLCENPEMVGLVDAIVDEHPEQMLKRVADAEQRISRRIGRLRPGGPLVKIVLLYVLELLHALAHTLEASIRALALRPGTVWDFSPPPISEGTECSIRQFLFRSK